MQLIFPTLAHKQAALDFRQEHFDHGETVIHGDGGLDTANTYEEWLAKVQEDVTQAREGFVPATVYFGMQDGTLVGIIQIRHELNQHLLEGSGHIGYGVRPSERRKGYATQMLALALDKCREMGIDRVLVSCYQDNIASAKTILKNGGVAGMAVENAKGKVLQQYWIKLD